MKRRIYIRAGMSPLEPVSVGDAVQKNMFGANTGNLIFQYSVFRTLMCRDTEFDARLIMPVYNAPGGVEALDEACDCAVFPLANAFRMGFDLKPMTDMIRRLSIPCMVIGCGVQAADIDEIRRGFPFDEDVKAFVNAVLDKSALIGVRGELTGYYLESLGYVPERHFSVIGCPSMFLHGDRMPAPRVTDIDAGTRFSINTRPVQTVEMNNLIARTEARYPKYHLALQMQRELAMLAYGTGNGIQSENRDKTGYYPFNSRHRDVRGGKVVGFTQARAWFDYMKGIDYSFGSRIHGNMAAVLSGVPAFVFCSDTRTEELCRYGRIPHMPINTLKPDTDIRDILEKADFAGVCRGYRERFDHFVDFLDRNGLEHIYKNGATPKAAPFDEALAKLPFSGAVKWGCLPRGEARRRWLQVSVEKLRQRFKL